MQRSATVRPAFPRNISEKTLAIPFSCPGCNQYPIDAQGPHVLHDPLHSILDKILPWHPEVLWASCAHQRANIYRGKKGSRLVRLLRSDVVVVEADDTVSISTPSQPVGFPRTWASTWFLTSSFASTLNMSFGSSPEPGLVSFSLARKFAAALRLSLEDQ